MRCAALRTTLARSRLCTSSPAGATVLFARSEFIDYGHSVLSFERSQSAPLRYELLPNERPNLEHHDHNVYRGTVWGSRLLSIGVRSGAALHDYLLDQSHESSLRRRRLVPQQWY